ncbi:MAG: hypothetical protein WC719_02440 [Patescibacteria group bacterium]
MKSFVLRFKFVSLAILAILILIPVVVFALNNPLTGYDVQQNALSMPVFFMDNATTVHATGVCINNITGDSRTDSSHIVGIDYFVPTKTSTEFANFSAFKNSTYLIPVACYGDLICSPLIGENCANDPLDCGTCVYTGGPCDYDEVCDQDEGQDCTDCDAYCDNDCICEDHDVFISDCLDCYPYTNCGSAFSGCWCGDGYCDGYCEDYGSCAQDCPFGT